MSRPTDVIDPCTICGKPKANHPYRHAWVGYGSDRSGLFENTAPQKPESNENRALDQSIDQANPSSQGRIRNALQGDPVLRLALIRKGLLTVQDLDDIEAELRASGVAGHDPANPVG